MASKKMTVAQIISISSEELSKMSIKELKEITSLISRAANKRVKYMVQTGNMNTLIQKALEQGKFTSKGNINQVRANLFRAINFMSNKQSTVKGWNEVKQKSIEKLKQVAGIDLPSDMFDNVWKVYEDLKELDETVSLVEVKYHIIEVIKEYFDTHPEMDIHTVFEAMVKRKNEIYEEEMEEYNNDESVKWFNDFFK